jgi:hypothetical protein
MRVIKPFKTDRFHIQPSGTERRWTTGEDIAIIKGMLARGDKQSDVAAYWGTNSGRIAETNVGRRYSSILPAPPHQLPPPGPHVSGNIQVVGIAEDFRREQQKTNEKLDHVLRQLAAFGRSIGLLENPQTPRIGRRKPMEA